MTAHAVPNTAPPVLEMRGVDVPSLRSPSELALEDVNWSVAAGEYWAVGGLLRSGKSDFLTVAGGLQPPQRGLCRLFGEDVLSMNESQQLALRRKVGFAFDGGQLLHHLTLSENIALPLQYHHEEAEPDPAARLNDLIALTGLEPWAGRYPTDVSRNWQQRFGLARALALRPELLLLDEPLSGLDPRDAAWWLETLSTLAAGHPVVGRPLTLIVTGNDLRPWLNSARRFALLQDKSFVVLGDRSALENHSQPVLADLLRPWQT